MSTFQFDTAAYRRIRLPWLLLLLCISLALDAVLIFIWQGGVRPDTKAYWDGIFVFLCITNLFLVKQMALRRYLYVKKLRARSEVRLEKNAVVHTVFLSGMSRGQAETAKETKLPAGGKTEYISADTFYIRHVESLSRRRSGSIVVEGNIERESLNEGWEEYSAERGKPFKKTIKRHTIPAYYEGMDAIFEALNMLR